MLLLYGSDHSLYCSKTRILLNHKGLDYREESPPGGSTSAAYRQIVPSGNLPALVHGDLVLSDSEAIAEYLEEAFPTPRMMPTSLDYRAKARERGRFHDTRLEPALRGTFALVKAGGGTSEQVTAALAPLTERIAQLTILLNDPLAPDAMLTLGDCGLPITFDWIDAISGGLGQPVEWPARIVEYRGWLDGFDAVRQERETRGPIISEWATSRLR
jgi:glutathione S-transferase